MRTSALILASLLVACGGRNDDTPLSQAGSRSASAGSETSGASGTAGFDEARAGAPAMGGTVAGGAAGEVEAAAGGAAGEVEGAAGDASTSYLLPSDCEPRGSEATGTSCSLSAFCSSIPQVVSCARLESGRWRCTSQLHHAERIYELEGAQGIQACGVAVGLSTEDQLKLGQESCESAPYDVDGYCLADRTCARPIEVDFAPSARAWLTRYGSAECTAASDQARFNCGCHDLDKTKAYYVSVGASTPMCGPLAEFCLSATGPDAPAEPSCLLTLATESAAGCERVQACSQPGALDATGASPRVGEQSVNCEPGENGMAVCYCSTRDSLFQFGLAAAPNQTTCASAILNCDANAEIKATGEATCATLSQTTDGMLTLFAEVQCKQPAAVDGRPIVAYESRTTSCSREQESDPWRCSCWTERGNQDLPLILANTSASDTSALATKTCLQQLPVHLGL
ncbi:MAG: hypothetical protein ABIQ16_24340 [Polyangiaceae bacterium]